MKRHIAGLFALLTLNTAGMATGVVALAPVAAQAAPPVVSVAPPVPPEKIATDRIKDLTLTIRVKDADMDELEKIGGSFKRSYYFKKMDVVYKFPNKTRLETGAAGVKGLVIFDGDTRYFEVPFKKGKSSIKGQPGQKQSLMNLGIFATDYLATDWEAKYNRREGNLIVYTLWQRDSDNTSHEIIWVNPKTKIIERRQTWSGDNKFKMETRYKGAREVRPGVYLPTIIEVWNAKGKKGATQTVEDIKVNLGVGDDQFKTP